MVHSRPPPPGGTRQSRACSAFSRGARSPRTQSRAGDAGFRPVARVTLAATAAGIATFPRLADVRHCQHGHPCIGGEASATLYTLLTPGLVCAGIGGIYRI